MKVVLVRPRDPNNIGAAARAMANFGFSELVVVAPHPPVWTEVRSAIGADEILSRARVASSLAEAVADCRVVAGTSSGSRRRLKNSLSPAEFFDHEDPKRDDLALVFGNEKHGLSRDDLDHCNSVVTIPTSAEQPSLNLAQAVTICCYEAIRVGRPNVQPEQPPATNGELEAFLAAIASEEPLSTRPPQLQSSAVSMLRSLLLRGRATNSELSLIRGLIKRG